LPNRFTDPEIDAISAVISQPRLSRYLAAMGGDRRRALALYRWNAQIAAALMFPLHICEVSTRNGIVGAIERTYGQNWHVAPAFERSLPYHQQGELKRARHGMQTAGKVVAELKFSFWSAMLTSRHDGRLWNPFIQLEFPNFGVKPATTCRNQLHISLEDIRRLRNRIAHHEPIFGRDLTAEFERIRQVIAWRSQATADWMSREQGVTSLLASKP
jgi:hypothetical protein